jgi:hypothetical protein
LPNNDAQGRRKANDHWGRNRAPVIHYVPAENLELVDVGLVDGARQEAEAGSLPLSDI